MLSSPPSLGATVSSLPPLTYNLGTSLYIPLTSRCNTRTLPQTRGPNFVLPKDVIQSLLTLRKLEEQELYHKKNNEFRSAGEGRQTVQEEECTSSDALKLEPSSMLPKVSSLQQHHEQEENDELFTLLTKEIQYKTSERYTQWNQGINDQSCSSNNYSSFVIAGEGEPTLRLPLLLSLAQFLSSDQLSSSFNKTHREIRVVTNGLGNTIKQNQNLHDNHNILLDMKEAGVTSLSVALMTSCPIQYEQLMKPVSIPNSNTSKDDVLSHNHHHDHVCQFIKEGVALGLDVEVTGVDYNTSSATLDKERAEKLARELGVTKPFRWRPFFP